MPLISNQITYLSSKTVQNAESAERKVFRSSQPLSLALKSIYPSHNPFLNLPSVFQYKIVHLSFINEISSQILQHRHLLPLLPCLKRLTIMFVALNSVLLIWLIKILIHLLR